jgi:hypothetical protein
MGRLLADWTRVTIGADELNDVISHAAPTACIQPPMFETTLDVHNDRNTGSLNGAQNDCVMVV